MRLGDEEAFGGSFRHSRSEAGGRRWLRTVSRPRRSNSSGVASLGPGEHARREAASDRVPTAAGPLMAWRTCVGRGRSSAPGGRCHPTSGPGTGLRATDPRAPHVSGFQFSEKIKNLFPHMKNRYKVRKNLEKIKEVGNPIWSNFCDYIFLRFFTDFELFQRF
jgi:hypothetical protein